jgi:hypothetical protein
LTQLLDGFVQAFVELHEGVARPKGPLEFLAADQPSGAFQQQSQHPERLILERDLPAALPQLTRREICLE